MSLQFENFRQLAIRLITKNGRKVTFQFASSAPVNSAEPWKANTADTVKNNVPCVFLAYENTEANNTLIQVGDKRCLVAKLSLPNSEPRTKDTIVDGKSTWNIVSVKTLQPGGLDRVVMYDLQVRA